MAEIEYKGIKLGGSKLVILVPLLGTLIGGLWGGFELYNRLLIAEKKLAQVNPTQIEAKMSELIAITDLIRDDLSGDIDLALKLARSVDKTSADTQREIRNDVYAMEKEMQGRFREMDKDIRDNKKELEEKIVTILENPLNDTE
jgi:gas vesicle protein|tara:strand:+ start:218 stop:649 length:432 start_codon:yes stop_codon:yes gene_type:complete